MYYIPYETLIGLEYYHILQNYQGCSEQQQGEIKIVLSQIFGSFSLNRSVNNLMDFVAKRLTTFMILFVLSCSISCFYPK